VHESLQLEAYRFLHCSFFEIVSRLTHQFKPEYSEGLYGVRLIIDALYDLLTIREIVQLIPVPFSHTDRLSNPFCKKGVWRFTLFSVSVNGVLT
jgi:hypothetical protein